MRSRQRPGKKRRPPRRRPVLDAIAQICNHVWLYGTPRAALDTTLPHQDERQATTSLQAMILTGIPDQACLTPVPARGVGRAHHCRNKVAMFRQPHATPTTRWKRVSEPCQCR